MSVQSEMTWRSRLGIWIESTRVQQFIIGLIVLNAVTLGLETSQAIVADYGQILHRIDQIILWVFLLEITIKLIAFGWRFFLNAWNIFDFLIVGIALIPSSGPLTILRTLRILRVLRLLSMVPQLRFVIEALLHAIPGIGSIAGLMVVLYYVFAVMATSLFGVHFPEWFGTIGRSMYTLFQVMTLESWSMGISRPVMQQFPLAWLFFVPFILIATFTILNLFIAIIVNTMQTLHEKTAEKETAEISEAVHNEGLVLEHELRALKKEILSLRQDLLKTTKS